MAKSMWSFSLTANSNNQVFSGGAGNARRQQPAFWKRWMISMVAVYPPLVCLVFVSRYLLNDVPMVVSLFIIAFCLTGLSTGLILPFLHRRLHGWLHR